MQSASFSTKVGNSSAQKVGSSSRHTGEAAGGGAVGGEGGEAGGGGGEGEGGEGGGEGGEKQKPQDAAQSVSPRFGPSLHFNTFEAKSGNSFWQKSRSSRLFLSSQTSHLTQLLLHCFLHFLFLQSAWHLSSQAHFSGQLRHGGEGGGEGDGGIGGGIGGGEGGGDEGGGDGGGHGGGGNGDGGGGLGRAARSTGSQCGGHTLGWSVSARLLATLGLVMCGVKAAPWAAQKMAEAPMRTSARKRDAPFVACVSSHWATGRSRSTWSEVGLEAIG